MCWAAASRPSYDEAFTGGIMRAWVGPFIFASLVMVSGCRSGPKFTIADAILADVPVSEKENMLKMKSEMETATEEKNKATSDLAAADRDVSVAESEYGQAKLEVSKNKAEVELANASKDMNKVTAAKTKLQQVEMGRDIAESKVDWQKARRKHS
jgi:uncharacterized protein (DUF3084 family)